MAVQNHAKTERLGGTGSLPVAATMIRKITVLSPKAMSFEFNEHIPATKDFLKMAEKEFSDNKEFFHSAYRLVSFLNQYPDYDVMACIRATFGPDINVKITKKTKTYLVYAVRGGLYIHEEVDIFWARKCDVTGAGMDQGYCFGDGEEYAATKKAALVLAKKRGYKTLNEAYKDGAYYWTSWEDDDKQYKQEGNKLIKL